MQQNIRKFLPSILTASLIGLFAGCFGGEPEPEVKGQAAAPVETENQSLTISFEDAEVEEKNGKRYRVVELNNNDESSKIIQLINDGEKPLRISKIKTTSTTPKLFSMTVTDCNKAIAPEAFCEIKVSFTGKKEGLFEQLITFNSNDENNLVSYVKVQVEAKNRLLASLEESNKNNNMSPMKELSFNKLNTTKYIDIENIGTETLDIAGLKIQGANAKNFSAVSSCPKKLEVGQKCKITTTYNPALKKGMSTATLNVMTNGKISPSSKIVLNGSSEPFTLTVSSFIVSKNINEYMDDYFSSNNTYFLRTIYQTQIDKSLEKMIVAKLNSSLSNKSFKKVLTPSKAKKILSIYPNITFEEEQDSGKMKIKVGMHGFFATKVSYKKSKLVEASKIALEQKTDHVNFTSIDSIKQFYDKEPFSFFLEIDVTGYEDKNDIHNKLSEIIAEKFTNVLGLQ